MRRQLQLLLLLLLCSKCTSPASSNAPMEKANNSKPNIVYILADDMGYGDVSANNPQSKN